MAEQQPRDVKAKSGDELQLVVFNIGTEEFGVEPAPAVIANKIGKEYVRGVGKMEDRFLILLDLDKIISNLLSKNIT
ncbi:MAG: hypothetical protein C3F06_00855 [Candidatus Methanoperedenaceae archaeon]|nr:MAG: hypothetical protein C3F06_00855 [Candidatus Methanoperedenaceae archaeon]